MRLALLAALMLSSLTAVADDVTPAAVRQAIANGVNYLMTAQNDDGSWGTHRSIRAYSVYAPIPGGHFSFRTATTALAVRALLLTAADEPAARRAIERGVDWLLEAIPEVKRDAPDALYCNWAFLFGIDALVTYETQASWWRSQQVRRVIRHAIQRLERYASISGGWVYYDFTYHAAQPVGKPASFMTAAAVSSLLRARAIGIAVPDHLLRRALWQLQRCRLPDDAFIYNPQWRWWPRALGSRLPSSLGRTQAGLYALRLANGPDAVTDGQMRRALERFLVRNDWLGIGRKRPMPHESWFSVAGYYYCFGHAYASRLISLLPVAEQEALRYRQAAILLPVQEPDGAWWDFPLYGYGKAYGTAFILQALAPLQ